MLDTETVAAGDVGNAAQVFDLHVSVGQFRLEIGHLKFGGVGERTVIRVGLHAVTAGAGRGEIAFVEPGIRGIGTEGDALRFAQFSCVQRADLDLKTWLGDRFKIIVKQMCVEHDLAANRVSGPVSFEANPLMLAHEPRQGEELDALRPDPPVILVARFEAKQPEAVGAHHHAFAGAVTLPGHQRVTVGA